MFAPRTLQLAALASLAWLACACSEEPRTVQQPQLLLRVHSTTEVREAMDRVRITAAVERTPGADGGLWTVREGVSVSVADRDWPIDIPVVPKDIDTKDGRFELVIEALDGNDVLVQARAITRWFDGGVRILDVWLLRCGTAVFGELCEDDPECHGDACSVCIDPIVGLCGFVQEVDPQELELLGLEDAVPVDLLWPPEFPLDAGTDAGMDAGTDAGQRVDSGVGRDAGGGDPCAELDCDDGNPCTVDSCTPEDGCDNDGTGVTIDCAPDDNCNSAYVCQGDRAGTCSPLDTVDCSSFDDDCHVGVCDMADGNCDAQALPDDMVCEDGDACTEGESCQGGVCGGGSTRSCDDSNPCTTDSCDSVQGCLRVNTDVPSCTDDDPCTVGDHCSAGLCTPTGPRACSDANDCTDDTCNSADTDGDPCLHVNNTATCNDGNSCTATSMCVSGSCIGSGNACGPNALSCVQGTPNMCTCMTNYVDDAGQCVPTTNECDMGICSANANCNDPSSALGNVQCSCPVGFTGDGRVAGTGCTDINECAGNPCGAGRGTCTQGAPGTYSCNCNGGYTTVNGTCACDLNGTFAVRIDATLQWAGDSTTEASGAGGAGQYLWARWTLTYGANGTLNATIQPCGSTSVDLCANVPTIGNRAYAQWVPVNVWNGSAGSSMVTVNNVVAIPGANFQTPTFASLVGISLSNPLGVWPSSRSQVNGSVNGATWADMDSDGKLGVTSYTTPPGGITPDGSPPDPPQTFASTSVECPRLSAAARWAYAYYPAPDGINPIRLVKRFQMAARTMGHYDAGVTSCNQLDGNVGGPDQGQLQSDVRIGGCVRENGAGELDCTSTVVDFFDGTEPFARYVDATFTAVRVANGTTCDQVRAIAFP